jgi:hypothetical protein
MPFPELLSAPSCVALQAGAFAPSSDSNAHYGCDWSYGISLCSSRNKPSLSASHLILNAVIEEYICLAFLFHPIAVVEVRQCLSLILVHCVPFKDIVHC